MAAIPALVLLSGGLDSVTALAWAHAQGYALRGAVSFTYGQRHAREIESAAAIAAHYGVPYQAVALTPIGGSPLTDRGPIPQGRDLPALIEDLAPTYVPNRNLILLAYAAALALLGDATHLIGGWNAADAQNYPDCRESFLAAAQATLRLATRREFTIVRPLIDDDKPAIVRRALRLGAPIPLTWTCYLGEERACGTCDACQLRIAAFRQVGVVDPLPYAPTLDWAGCRPYLEESP
ncbi:MAG TPA: 7-cyano-7-deazaguanine synthase QueC [Chloroflexia bacterium]|nr:7-cyano-7-deazaguanine synthase QueC [Chloroflexia bacterium]